MSQIVIPEVKKFHDDWVSKMLNNKKQGKIYYVRKNNNKCFDCGIDIVQVRNGRLMYCLRCKKNRKRVVDKKRKQSLKYKEYVRTHINYFRKYKDNARYRGIEFSLTKEEFQSFWQKSCNYCNSEIKSIGLDRVNNNTGYIMENLVSCCKNCNLMKRSMTVKEFINQCKRIIDYYN